MQRHNSKASVGSVESSRGGGRKPAPTHVIIQRENSDDLLLLPVTHLVNAVATRIKLNDTATFKIDLNSRKQERGMVVSFGKFSWLIDMRWIFVYRIRRCLCRANPDSRYEYT